MKMVSAILMASISAVSLPMGQPMPSLKGEFLTGRQAVLPDTAAGHVALVALGFTYDSRYSVDAWIGRFRKDYGANRQVTFYEVPMIDGIARLGKWFIDSGMRKGTPVSDQENVITVYGDTRPWKQRMDYHSPSAAYLVLLDRRGIVRWRFSGPFDEGAYRELSAHVSDLLQVPQ